MAIDESDEIRQPGSSTPSMTGSTCGCTGIRSYSAPNARRLYTRNVLRPSNEFGDGCTSKYSSSRRRSVASASTKSGSIASSTIVYPCSATSLTASWGSTGPRLVSPPMALYALGDIEPQIDAEAFVHEQATIIGNVVIGPGSTIWPQAVLRGDQSRIVVGARTSVQDGAVLHCTRELETIVGSDGP